MINLILQTTPIWRFVRLVLAKKTFKNSYKNMLKKRFPGRSYPRIPLPRKRKRPSPDPCSWYTQQLVEPALPGEPEYVVTPPVHSYYSDDGYVFSVLWTRYTASHVKRLSLTTVTTSVFRRKINLCSFDVFYHEFIFINLRQTVKSLYKAQTRL